MPFGCKCERSYRLELLSRCSVEPGWDYCNGSPRSQRNVVDQHNSSVYLSCNMTTFLKISVRFSASTAHIRSSKGQDEVSSALQRELTDMHSVRSDCQAWHKQNLKAACSVLSFCKLCNTHLFLVQPYLSSFLAGTH